MRRVVLLAGVVLGLLLAGPVAAQSPERTEAFVWAATVFSGAQYESTFYPPDRDALYLMADRDHVLAPRRTLIYYWPITNRILADWLAQNEVVEGELVIRDGRRQVRTLPLTDYVIQFDADAPASSLALYTGPEARRQYTAFDAARKEYATQVHANYQAQLEYDAAMTAAAQAATRGETVDLPEEPPQLPPFTWYSTEVKRAFVVNLPAGDYEISLRLPDGTEQPTSRKRLHVFRPRRTGIGYKVVPEAKWTLPEESNDPQNVIYALPGTTLYLQPYHEFEANQLAYARMVDAQREGVRADRYMWVQTYPYAAATLQILQGSQVVATVPRRDYFVRQLPGASLGYQVELYDPTSDRSPSFSGYALRVDDEQSAYQVRLIDAAGVPVPGSRRTVRIIRQPDRRVVFSLPLLPLMLGLGVLVWRRRRLERLDPGAEE